MASLLGGALELLQRGDLGLKLRGNLLKSFRRRRLGFLQMFSGSLRFNCGLALFGLNELLLSLLYLNTRLLRRRRELFQRRFTENLFTVRQGHGRKIGNGLFDLLNGRGIHRRMAGNQWPGRPVRSDTMFSGLRRCRRGVLWRKVHFFHVPIRAELKP